MPSSEAVESMLKVNPQSAQFLTVLETEVNAFLDPAASH